MAYDDSFHGFFAEMLPSAGELIMSYRSQHADIAEKEKNEIVTPADMAVNDFLIEQLRKAFPEIGIYSEEGGADYKSEASTRWIVDPIDGTTPWVWGNSGFAISIALEENREVSMGVVYDPVMKELFFSRKGQGATRNGNPLHVSEETTPANMLLVVDWGNSDEKRHEGLTYYRKFMLPDMFARRIVPQFAPALGLCRIAEGRTHALVCNDTWVEDHAAGALILREAGGYCTNFYDTDSFSHQRAGIIAANQRVSHEAITKFLTVK